MGAAMLCCAPVELSLANTAIQLGADIDGEAAGHASGYSVSLSTDGRLIAIGSPEAPPEEIGKTQVYKYSGGVWTQVGSDIDGEVTQDRLGFSVSLSGDGSRLAIGAPYNSGNGLSAGQTRVYEFAGGTWTQLGADIDGETAGDQSGYFVALSSDGARVAVGAPYNDGNGEDAGHTRVFEFAGGVWTQLGTSIDGEAAGDLAGESVALSSDGSRVAVGAPYNDSNGMDAGHARVYEFAGGVWTKLGADIDGEAADDLSGGAVSLSSDGDRLAIGAIGNDGANGILSGHTRVYEYASGAWTQLGADIDGEAAEDFAGNSVALSSDGTRVAIGAPLNDGDGDRLGQTRVYDFVGNTWTQFGSDISGEADGDRSGRSISLSADGSTVAVGSINNSANGAASGHTRVYQLTEETSTGTGSAISVTTLPLTLLALLASMVALLASHRLYWRTEATALVHVFGSVAERDSEK